MKPVTLSDVETCVAALDRLALPREWSRERAANVLRAAGYKVATDTLTAALRARRDTAPQALYRFYDAAGRLLYVGITADLPRRLGRHKRDRPWWADVTRVEVAHYPDRENALAAEAEAITDERPLYNVRHNARPALEVEPVEVEAEAVKVDTDTDSGRIVITITLPGGAA